jgi:hypothetical protein
VPAGDPIEAAGDVLIEALLQEVETESEIERQLRGLEARAKREFAARKPARPHRKSRRQPQPAEASAGK